LPFWWWVDLSLYATSSDLGRRGAGSLSPRAISIAIALLSAAALAGALGIEYIGGIRPCPLCLDQRIAYYAAVPVALIAAWLSGSMPGLARLLLVLLALAFLFNAGLGVYHAGIEWGWWPGPDECSGMAPLATSPGALLESLQKQSNVIRCDAAALRILGLSLAGYSALLSAFLAALAAYGVMQRSSRTAV
jgi:disulfide bond formation protein DsbB